MYYPGKEKNDQRMIFLPSTGRCGSVELPTVFHLSSALTNSQLIFKYADEPLQLLCHLLTWLTVKKMEIETKRIKIKAFVLSINNTNDYLVSTRI